ncbi:filamentous hemagglutinin N-terminal domain-containing protein [Marinobacterium sp. D7]|uniref:two-partner secretion domain-containing protein n=1 Tax=Marinobacterium ramblicola TaxID=2849041 RepID=UPI001C2D32F8|nr:filamentous hemagglutinin N-terminal domain-containing protein [Marinobacterium ramblicola]MBV1789260.1 filamentous hemagglutinin N-terminal domain-containing protein [Marinobacterium ramblicola]
MNKHLFRIIFSKARGMLVVVAESTRSRTKCRTGRGRSIKVGPPILAKPLTLWILLALGAPFALIDRAVAEIIVDSTAPASQRPTLGTSANGTTRVDIQTPSAAGVSRNTYSRFDVEQRGVILNNARTAVNTRIGGFVDGNPNLGHGEAGIILNEVNAADPSRLNGFIEVAGQRAEVIVANPAGISCSGCGFINASRSTLTTGTPLIEGGRLEGFRVEGGTISIGAGGLNDSDSDYTQLIARAVEVNASIQAQELRVTTGSNDVGRDAQPTTVNTPSPGSSAPAFALDVAQLGGMYAGKILLVGTENGVGVRNAGSIGAMTGSLSLSADGKLTNSGLISAATDAEIEVTGALDNSGSIYAAGDQTITAEQIDNSDIIAAGQDLSLTATDSISGTSDSILAAGVNGDLSLADSGSLSLNAAGALTLHGQNLAADRLQMQAAAIDMTNSTNLATDVDIRAQSGDIDTGSTRITAVGQATLTTDNGDLLNGNGQILAKNLNTNVNGTLDNRSGLMQASDTLSLTAVNVDNRNTNGDNQGLRATDIDFEAATLDNSSGFIGAVDSLQLSVEQQLDNSNGGITALNKAVLNDSSSGTLAIVNTSGKIQAGNDLQLQALTLSGSGSLQSGGDLSLTLQQDHTLEGELRADHDATLNVAGELTNAGTLAAINQLSVYAVNLNNAAEGEITAATALLNIDGALQNRGLIDGGLVRIEAQLLDNIGSGRLYGDHLATQIDQLQNRAESGSPATLAARDRLDLGLRTLTNSDGSLIFSAGDLAIGRELDSDNRATGQAELLDNRSASIEALGDIVIDVATLQNVDDDYQVTKTLLSNEAHTDYRPKNSATRYDSSLIQWGHTSKGATKIISPFNAEDFYVYNYTRSISEDRVSNQAPASILSGGNMQIDADTLINDQSKLLAGGALVANAGTLQNDEINLQRYTQDSGTVYFTWVDSCGKDDHCREYGSKSNYAPAQQIQTLSTLTGTVDQNQAITGSGTSLSAYAAQGTLINLSGIDGQQVQLGGDSVDGVVRSGGYLSLPNAGLFTTSSGDVSQPLIETDPRFTSYRSWLNAEYALGRLTTNPDITQRRLGDGFIEQRLVQQQISELTGRRYLPGFSNDEEQYRALLDAGVTFGSTFNLSPGIALTEAQMQQLTSDIVWLVEESVSLPDGTRANVLVPRVYALVQAGDLNGSGALLGGNNVDLNIDNRLSNSGRILAAETLLVDAADLTNRRGGIAARQLQLTTAGNLNNEGGLIQAEHTLSLGAGGDLNLTTLTRATENRVDGNEFEQESVDSVGTLLVTGEEGVLSARAEGDLNLTGAAVVNQGANGSTTLSAGNDLNLLDLHTRRRDALVWDSRNYLKEESSQSIGTLLSGEGRATLVAGRDINTRAAEIDLNGDLQAVAGRDLNIAAGQNTSSQDESHYITSSGLLSSKTMINQYRRESATAQGSSLQAGNATLAAGRDLNVTGSTLITDNDLSLQSGNDINIQAAENSHLSESFSSKTKSGLMSGGDFGVFVGTRLNSKQIDERRTGLSVSTLGPSTARSASKSTTISASPPPTFSPAAAISASRATTSASTAVTTTWPATRSSASSRPASPWRSPAVWSAPCSRSSRPPRAPKRATTPSFRPCRPGAADDWPAI